MTVQSVNVEPCSFPRITMSASTLHVCFELGYHEIGDLPSRGPPKLLLDDLKALVEDTPVYASEESLSAGYLASKPAGLKHKLPENACQLQGMLSWPRDRLMLVDIEKLSAWRYTEIQTASQAWCHSYSHMLWRVRPLRPKLLTSQAVM